MRKALSLAVTLSLAAGCSGSGSRPAGASTSGAADAAVPTWGKLSVGPVVIRGAQSKPLTPPAVTAATSRPALASGLATTSAALTAGCSSVALVMKVLVISSDGSEAALAAIKGALDHHTIPYTVWTVSQNPGGLTAAALGSGCAGNYQAVVLANNLLPLSAAEWQALSSYEAGFGVREVSWYTYPGYDNPSIPGAAGEECGLASTTSGAVLGLTATLTAAGQAAFPYLQPSAAIPIASAWGYLTKPLAANGATPLVVDSAGDALVSTFATSDGREVMSVTYDSNDALLHDLVLAHGFVEWVTRGVYLGQYRAYLTPQEDDMFIPDDVYPTANYQCPSLTACSCGGLANASPPSGGCFCGPAFTAGTTACSTYRMSASDMSWVAAWQDALQAQPGNAGFRLGHAFNGSGEPTRDLDLEAAARAVQSKFLWINHTFSHMNLDNPNDPLPGGPTTGVEVSNQWIQNESFATAMGFTSYRSAQFVSPDVSGLTNPRAMQALSHLGVRYMVTNTSLAGWDNPAPNVGIWSPVQRNIYLVPRRPTNLFYNVSTPGEWVAEYNGLFCRPQGNGCALTTWFTAPQTFDQVLDFESNVILTYMLRGDMDPHMYHQANLRQYSAQHTLIGDLLDKVVQKYRAYSRLPIQSLDLDEIGRRMKATGQRNASGLTATLTLAADGAPTGVTLASRTAMPVVVSGVCAASGTDRYGPAGLEKCITTVTVPASGTITLPIQ